jgi:zinc transport system ATP-binding protein
MTTPAVAVQNVGVRYGALFALRDVSLEVEEGAFVAIIGPNGAGKSTLLNVILGLVTPDMGQVRLFGAPTAQFPGAQLGYIPQVKTLDRSFPARAEELVITGLTRGWPWRMKREQREAAHAAMQLTKVAHLARRQLSRLSGGELQRVYLARTLIRRPRLLVLDEPAAGMDVAGEADMYHMLDAYQRESGATVLMITHDWEGARYHASKVLLLNREVLAYGPGREVAREENLLHAFGHTGHIAATHGEKKS